MPNSIMWAVFVVALGLPGATVGLLFRRLEKKLDRADDSRTEKEETRQRYEELMIELAMASLSLSEATATALQRMPDAKCNGDMSSALSWSKEVKLKYHQFAREQAAKTINA